MFSERYKSHHDASRDLKNKYTADIGGAEYLPSVLAGNAASRRVIYLHVPFCNKICTFCPFHRPDELSRREYHLYLINEMRKICGYRYMSAPIDAINFGGGTPTSLSPEQMSAVLSELHRCFSIAPDAEISVETSATELSDEMISALKEGGVNRLSVGIQSFDDEARKLLGRRGNGEFAASRIAAAIRAGIRNTSVDLIYNYPGQTDAGLLRDIDTIAALDVAGVSIYSLMLHEKTPLRQKLTDAEKAAMSDINREKALFDIILDSLAPHGYRLLELTKLVKDGRDRYDYMEIRHSGGSCIALGHGAGGNIENYFYHNSHAAPDISDELRICSRGRVLLPEYRVLDSLVYALQKGSANLRPFSEKLDIDLRVLFEEKLAAFADAGLLTAEGDTVTLTRDGVFYGNNIISALIGRVADSRKI